MIKTGGRIVSVFSGSCLCRTVRFEVEAPTLWVAHCHCTMCRRAHGAAFVSWVGAAVERFRLTAGEDELRWYASSEDSERGFCPRCGSTLFFRSKRWPMEVHAVLANFDGEIDRDPQAHVYTDTAVDWVHLGDSLPRKPDPARG